MRGLCVIFFFSSRRRHTRWNCDWSSDVCSSDLGALGVWTALEYAPASYSTTNEIIALARAARRHGGIYASHMRNEGVQIDQALNELFRIAREAEIPAEVSHLKVSGRNSWGRMRRVLARI